MTDKKFTDEEIIEALDLCTQQNGSIPCYDCPCWNDDEQECKGIDYTATLDLIKRQKAEIERLNKKVEELSDVLSDTIKIRYAEAKVEAYKEFAERIRECCNSNNELSADAWLSVTTDINCVLKEMVGEQE
jgi:hypothetical protein